MRKVLSIIIFFFAQKRYGYDDYHFIQFDNHQSTLKAIEYYSALSCVEFVTFYHAVVNKSLS